MDVSVYVCCVWVSEHAWWPLAPLPPPPPANLLTKYTFPLSNLCCYFSVFFLYFKTKNKQNFVKVSIDFHILLPFTVSINTIDYNQSVLFCFLSICFKHLLLKSSLFPFFVLIFTNTHFLFQFVTIFFFRVLIILRYDARLCLLRFCFPHFVYVNLCAIQLLFPKMKRTNKNWTK